MNRRRKVVIKRVKLDAILNSNGHKFVTVQFIKKNGEWRTMNGRFKVVKHLHLLHYHYHLTNLNRPDYNQLH